MQLKFRSCFYSCACVWKVYLSGLTSCWAAELLLLGWSSWFACYSGLESRNRKPNWHANLFSTDDSYYFTNTPYNLNSWTEIREKFEKELVNILVWGFKIRNSLKSSKTLKIQTLQNVLTLPKDVIKIEILWNAKANIKIKLIFWHRKWLYKNCCHFS